MKKRSKFFLSKENIDHDSEQFDYIKELHEYLWEFIRAEIPTASGSISQFVDFALEKAKKNRAIRDEIKELIHHKDTTCGLWATDRPDLIPSGYKEFFFQIDFKADRDIPFEVEPNL